jgi:hypothetical protein
MRVGTNTITIRAYDAAGKRRLALGDSDAYALAQRPRHADKRPAGFDRRSTIQRSTAGGVMKRGAAPERPGAPATATATGLADAGG